MSPLDSANMTEVELTEEQEAMLSGSNQATRSSTFGWSRSRSNRHRAAEAQAQAKIPVTTSPWTSVSRMSRPPKR